ncbi:MAG: 16S rRNA (uracil(1498)-N(3))-methyltransferase [Proteobacteria bacterium]|nr:16S rRNA (uracil(1498)-N(3))-methyltransferase [Pseudomonadota bacterium]
MSSHTFYIPPADISLETALLKGDELKHARNTLRLGPGDEVQIIDGEGGRFEMAIEAVEKTAARLRILSKEAEPPPSFALTLAMGIVPGERYDWAVQKGTELGAAAIIPLVTERTEGTFRVPWKRLERLRRVAVSACKQCGRARFPRFSEPAGLVDLDPGNFDIAVAFWEEEKKSLSLSSRKDGVNPGTGLMVVGPVGGLSREEAERLRNRGCLLAGLGPRVLRTETAVAAGTALMQYLFGDMG